MQWNHTSWWCIIPIHFVTDSVFEQIINNIQDPCAISFHSSMHGTRECFNWQSIHLTSVIGLGSSLVVGRVYYFDSKLKYKRNEIHKLSLQHNNSFRESSKHCRQSLLQESLVDAHELSNESLQVEDRLAAQLQSVLIVGSHLSHLCLQLTITVHHQLWQQTLQTKVWHHHYCIIKGWHVTELEWVKGQAWKSTC